MRWFVLIATCLLGFSLCDPTPLYTQKYLEELKKNVTWEVVEYEESIFRGWSEDEFKKLLGDSAALSVSLKTYSEIKPNTDDLPDEIDWTNSRCTHEIRNQGKCGSCWAFATAGVVSDRCCMQSMDFGWLSPQELISCDNQNSGCLGGLASTALQYVHDNGLVPEFCYPYKAKKEECPKRCSWLFTSPKFWNLFHVCKCENLVDCSGWTGMRGCLKNGPIAVRMKVYDDFGAYKKGIYCRGRYSKFLAGHAIKCVGYGTSPIPYLKCANSWGTKWGMDGYFKIMPTEYCGVRLTPRDAWSVTGCQRQCIKLINLIRYLLCSYELLHIDLQYC
eukprot:TRINITY_DN37_c0_g1_i2.p1 TRINITY_DN37_c0_g1~~TRINITY_DN37_c0_g1_i2.p1  ORF type:complete len:332 (-),score=-6.24 TRINITY_DN37_c0_g1_i2:37-1032(-)